MTDIVSPGDESEAGNSRESYRLRQLQGLGEEEVSQKLVKFFHWVNLEGRVSIALPF